MSRVAVLKGGRSLERQVSLRSGARSEDALARLGHEVVSIDVDADLIQRLREAAPDVAFIAMHGRDGEDGTVQELLEILDIPYTGSRVVACIRATDKVLAKHLMLEAGIPTPEFFAFSETAFRELGAADALPAIEERLDFPIVVKPSSGGSALGIKFARNAADVPAALVAAFSYDSRVLLERYVDGRDLAVSILDGEALPVVEAVPRDEEFYDFEARYEIGRTDFICPADLPPDITARAHDLALRTYRLLGCEAFARVDLMLDRDGELTVLEVNLIPGLTETSLLPQAAEAAGISFDDARRANRGAGDDPRRRLALFFSFFFFAVLAGGEVLRRDVVEEVLELLDDLLGVLHLVLELDGGLGDHVLGGEDWRAGAHRERESVGGPRVDRNLAAVQLERDLGVEGVLAQLGDRDPGAVHLELGEHLADQVVRHRARRVGSLELHEDGGRLGVADPNREELVAVAGLQKHDRLLADHVEADAVDDHLLHRYRQSRAGGKGRRSPSETEIAMGDPGLEPGTSSLSETRSNRLS